MRPIQKLSYIYLIVAGFTPIAVSAAAPITLSGGSVEEFISNLYKYGLGFGGLLAVGMIAAGGVLIATSSVVNQQSKGKEMITGALWGLVLLFGSYFLLRTINPRLVELKSPGADVLALPPCVEGSTKIPGLECAPGLPAPEPPQPRCSDQLLLSCPNRFETVGVGIPENQTSPFLGVTDDFPPNDYWYDDDWDSIPPNWVIWAHPYYIDANAAGSSVPASETGTANARCTIYAIKKCSATSTCNTKDVDIENWVRPC